MWSINGAFGNLFRVLQGSVLIMVVLKKIALLKILATHFMGWYSLFINGPMIAWLFIKSFGTNRIQGIEIVVVAVIIVGLWTLFYFKYIFPHELALSSVLNPEWRKLMENTEVGPRKEERQP